MTHSKAVRVDPEIVATQNDRASCGMFCLYFLDQIVKGSLLNTIGQQDIPALRKETSLSFFTNSIPIDGWSMINVVYKHIFNDYSCVYIGYSFLYIR